MMFEPWTTAALRRRAFAAVIGLALAGPVAVPAQGLPTARPEQVGMSSERLSRVGEWLRGEVAQKKIPGAVIMSCAAARSPTWMRWASAIPRAPRR